MNSHPDFSRNVYCLLGLPFDAISLADTVARIKKAAASNTRCFLSTPNLNYLITAQTDTAFRNSIINSDLSIVDGMPIVWIAKLLGLPIHERVAGSTLFDSLSKAEQNPLSIFFFGGSDGVAEMACRKLNNDKKGLKCAGFEFPGFSSAKDMSKEEIINHINSSKADFLVVSVGARKGQAWIEHNRAQLTVPVISHLGAVINFAAGTVNRSPDYMQRAGLEWLWRIKEEPKLWRRYFGDGLVLFKLLSLNILPYIFFMLLHKPDSRQLISSTIKTSEENDCYVIHLQGTWIQQNIQPLRKTFAHASQSGKNIQLNMRNVTYIDSAFIGLVMLLYSNQLQCQKQLQLYSITKQVRRILRYSRVEFLINHQT